MSKSDDGALILPLHQPALDLLRPPRDEVVTYRIKVHLEGIEPPIWRRLDVASDLTLDVFHCVLQVAMGWTDSHLHAFSVGGRMYDRKAQRILTRYDLMEGDEGTLETDVRLDQVLQRKRARLFYEYDFGDSWSHVITLEAVEPRSPDAPRAVVLDGARACPPEDVGGVGGYEELIAAYEGRLTDAEEVAHLLTWAGPDFDPDRFSPAEVNDELRRAVATAELHAGLPAEIRAMLDRTDEEGRVLLEQLVAQADLDADTHVPTDVAKAMVAPYAWFLRRVGDDGVKLTAAGYLPPAVVVDAVAELAIDREWIGAMNRESETLPVLFFRESAQDMGLVKKRSGRLSLTARGRKLMDDPDRLWQHIATKLPLAKEEAERQAGIVLLLMVAADARDWQVPETIATVLASMGWRVQSGFQSVPLMPLDTWRLLHGLDHVLHRLGALRSRGDFRSESVPTPEGRILARAALLSL